MKYFLFIILVFFSCRKDIEIHSSYAVILVIGQSNCLNGEFLDSSIDLISNGIKQLGRFDDDNFKILDAKEPLQHHDPRPNKVGFALTFAKLFKKEFNQKVLIIPAAMGNTGFLDNMWNRGNPMYNDAIERVKFVLNNVKGSQLKAILWQQGERDVYFNNQNYGGKLYSMIKNMMEDIGSENTKNTVFLAGGMVPYWVSLNQNREKFQNIIKNINLINSKAFYVNPELPFKIEKNDNNHDTIHYNANGMRELGKRYFEVYKKQRL